MLGSGMLYAGILLAAAGLPLAIRPAPRLRFETRSRGLGLALTGILLGGGALALPVRQSRISRVDTRLDEFAPAWQFREFHTIRVAASPDQVFEAIKRVRADEIFLFRTLTWIRRGGRQLPPGILNASSRMSLIDVAIAGGFVPLADDPPRELVVATVVLAPAGTTRELSPAMLRNGLPPGFVVAMMNFLVTAEGRQSSRVSTETRVLANSPATRRRFAAYWRAIYPGSALIRRMWLRAIQRRATRS